VVIRLVRRTVTAPPPVVTSRRRRRPSHPDWCGRSHVCSAEVMSNGEHRSHPVTMDTDAGRVVLTRVQTRGGTNRMEVRAVVDLPTDPARARAYAAIVTRQICQATIVTVPAGVGS